MYKDYYQYYYLRYVTATEVSQHIIMLSMYKNKFKLEKVSITVMYCHLRPPNVIAIAT